VYEVEDDHQSVAVCDITSKSHKLIYALGGPASLGLQDESVPLYGELIFLRLLHTFTANGQRQVTIVRTTSWWKE
jgi:hypothetical protein